MPQQSQPNPFTRLPLNDKKHQLVARLVGHTGAIHTMALSPDDGYLATGGRQPQFYNVLSLIAILVDLGSDGIRFWNIVTATEIPAPYHTRFQDYVTKVVWATPGKGAVPVVCYGTALGYLVICRKVENEVSIDIPAAVKFDD